MRTKIIIIAAVVLLAGVALLLVFSGGGEPTEQAADAEDETGETASDSGGETEETAPTEESGGAEERPVRDESGESAARDESGTDAPVEQAEPEPETIGQNEALVEQAEAAIGNLTASNDRYAALIGECDTAGIENEKAAFGIHKTTAVEFIDANRDIDPELLATIEDIPYLYEAELERNAQLLSKEQAECSQQPGAG